HRPAAPSAVAALHLVAHDRGRRRRGAAPRRSRGRAAQVAERRPRRGPEDRGHPAGVSSGRRGLGRLGSNRVVRRHDRRRLHQARARGGGELGRRGERARSRELTRGGRSMLLVADVGNTNTKIGVFDGERLLVSWRLTSRREQTADEYGLFIETLLQSRGIRAATIDGVSISNVVPPVQQTLEWMCEKYFSRPPFFVEPGVNTRLPLAVDAPREVGADRYVDAFAATAKYGPPLIVIDFGTATTFNCVNRRGEFIGGAIAPGIVTSVEALINRAARLSR